MTTKPQSTTSTNASAEEIVTAPVLTDDLILQEADLALVDAPEPAVLWTTQELRRVLQNVTDLARRRQFKPPSDPTELFEHLKTMLPLPENCIRFTLSMDSRNTPTVETEYYVSPWHRNVVGQVYVAKEQYSWLKTGSKGEFRG